MMTSEQIINNVLNQINNAIKEKKYIADMFLTIDESYEPEVDFKIDLNELLETGNILFPFYTTEAIRDLHNQLQKQNRYRIKRIKIQCECSTKIVQYIRHIKKITVQYIDIECKECESIYNIKEKKDYDRLMAFDKDICCARTYRKILKNEKEEKTDTNKKHTVHNTFRTHGYLEYMCDKGHVIKRTQYVERQVSTNPSYQCPICRLKLSENFAIFKLLDEMGANYTVKQEYLTDILKRKRYKRNNDLKRLTIITQNDIGHITGKIVFDDTQGIQNILARKNNIVFRWLNPEDADDYDFCKDYLYDYFSEIVNKFRLR